MTAILCSTVRSQLKITSKKILIKTSNGLINSESIIYMLLITEIKAYTHTSTYIFLKMNNL